MDTNVVVRYLASRLYVNENSLRALMSGGVDVFKALSALENVTCLQDVVSLNLAMHDHSGERAKIILQKTLDAKRWLPKYRYFLRNYEWTSRNGLDFKALERMTLLEWQIFNFNPFVVIPHLLELSREKRPEWMAQCKTSLEMSTAVLHACILNAGSWNWRNDRCVMYAAAYLCLLHSDTVRVPIEDVCRFVTNMGVAWSPDVFDDFDAEYDPETAFSWSHGFLRHHPLWEVTQKGRRSIGILEAEAAWPSDEVYAGIVGFQAWMHAEFERLVNPVVMETRRDRTTNAEKTTLSLRENLSHLEAPVRLNDT